MAGYKSAMKHVATIVLFLAWLGQANNGLGCAVIIQENKRLC